MQIGVGIGITPFHFGGGNPILALFAAGEQGGFYDPSTMDGQFVDNLGTTPVTAAGDQVGLKMDKRLWGGRTLAQVMASQPNLVPSQDLTTWSFLNTSGNFSRTANSLHSENSLDGVYKSGIASGGSSVLGEINETKVVLSGSGTVRIVVYSGIGTTAATYGPIFLTGVPTEYKYYTPNTVSGSGGGFGIFGNGATPADCTVHSASYKDVPGNHRVQATAASRSILAREPVGGRRNLLVNTEEFNTTWAVQRCTVGVNAIAAPNGTLTADALVEDNQNGGRQFYQFFAKAGSSIQYTYSIFVKPALRTWIRLFPSTGGEVNGASQYYNLSGAGSLGSGSVAGSGFTNHGATITALPDGWYYLTLTFTTDANTAVNINAKGSTGDGLNTYQGVDGSTAFYLWGAQLELGSVATAYQRVGNTHDVTEAGKRDCWFWFYDGTDDGDATGNVDFSSVDKLFTTGGFSSFANTTAILFELGANYNTQAGSFYSVSGLNATLTGYSVASRGDASPGVNQTATFAIAIPRTKVVTGLHDISGDLTDLRLDSVSVATGTGDKGAGNFANQPLYFGRRAGSSIPFSGREYLSVIRAGIPTADQITAVERLIADRQGRTI